MLTDICRNRSFPKWKLKIFATEPLEPIPLFKGICISFIEKCIPKLSLLKSHASLGQINQIKHHAMSHNEMNLCIPKIPERKKFFRGIKTWSITQRHNTYPYGLTTNPRVFQTVSLDIQHNLS